ncbi:MAG TPA: hypothetical protein VNC78_00385 [Actinomycetota bacterium]|nr:hypothetical protein [Actinomycetota bacterium]
MTIIMVLGGLIIGALAAWLVSIAYREFIPKGSGDLAIPFLLVAGSGLLLAKKHHSLRKFAIGVVVGAGLETAFFLYLFKEMSQGIKGL